MEGTRNKPRCRPGLWPPIDVRRPSKEVGNRAGAADAAIVLVRYRTSPSQACALNAEKTREGPRVTEKERV